MYNYGFDRKDEAVSYLVRRRKQDIRLGTVKAVLAMVFLAVMLLVGYNVNFKIMPFALAILLTLFGLVDSIGKRDRYIEERIMPAALTLIGIALVIYTLTHWSDGNALFLDAFEPRRTTPIVIGIMGVTLIAGTVFNDRIRSHRCTESVTATCVDCIVHRGNRGGRSYEYIWEFMYNGEIIRTTDRGLNINGKYHAGSIAEIKVNPEDPVDIYLRPSSRISLSVGIGIVFIAASFLYVRGIIG